MTPGPPRGLQQKHRQQRARRLNGSCSRPGGVKTRAFPRAPRWAAPPRAQVTLQTLAVAPSSGSQPRVCVRRSWRFVKLPVSGRLPNRFSQPHVLKSPRSVTLSSRGPALGQRGLVIGLKQHVNLPPIGITIRTSSSGHYGSFWVLVPFLAQLPRARRGAEHGIGAAAFVAEDARGHQLTRVRAPGPPRVHSRGPAPRGLHHGRRGARCSSMRTPRPRMHQTQHRRGDRRVCWAQD